jgi:UDP-4-amino-4,6-dideoxy-N-acetyl-beta-L-altrosamine N-acetyltransferase
MLKGEKVILRPLKLDDWHKTIIWRNDINIKKLAMMHPFPITEMNEIEWYEGLLKSKSDRTIYFAVADKNDEPVGFIFLNNINRTNRNCYLGIVIGDTNNQGKGYGKDALITLLNYAFKNLNLKKVSVEVVETNINAIKLYKTIGFKEEGNMKEQFFSDGNYYNVLIMSKFEND